MWFVGAADLNAANDESEDGKRPGAVSGRFSCDTKDRVSKSGCLLCNLLVFASKSAFASCIAACLACESVMLLIN